MTDLEMEDSAMSQETMHDQFADDDLYAEPLPPRPRRRVFTPARAVLGGVVLVALGFVGGVVVQKGQGAGTGTASAAGPGGAAAFGRGAAGGGAPGGAAAGETGQAAAPTTGTVANVKGNTLYVRKADGTTVPVKVGTNAKVTRSASSSAGAVHPGDTVVVQGSTAGSGTVTATSVTATAKGVSVGGFGGGGGGGGGGGAPGGAAQGAGGAGAAGGSGAAGVPPGFAPPGG